MARKVVNRKELRKQSDAAESAEKGKKKKKEPKKKKAPAKRKRVAKKDVVVRLKAFWGVYSQSLKRVAMFEYNEKKLAEKKAETLSASGKSPHFVRPVKEVIEEE